jgi:general secretion pathway protein M
MTVAKGQRGYNAQLQQSVLLQRWRSLALREQFALGSLGLFMLSVLFYLTLWVPNEQRLLSARSAFETQRELNAYLNTHAPAVRNLAGIVRVRVEQPRLQGLVTTTAAAQGLIIERLDNSGNGALQVNLQPASFPLLLRWFGVLQEQGVEIAEAGLERADDEKIVARLSLQVYQ